MAQSTNYTLPTTAQWKAQYLEDIEMQAADAGVTIPPTAIGSDIDLRATALANALSVLTANQVLADNDSNPLNAEGQALDDIRIADGLPEAPAQAASGFVTVSVTAVGGVTVPDGHKIQFPGAQFATVSGIHYGVTSGTELPFVMTKVGSVGNLAAGTKGRFTDPVPGLATECSVAREMTDGADTESDAKKRRRIINRRQTPPKGDNWSRIRELCLGATNAIDNAFVYMALGGPSSCGVTLSAPWFNGGDGQSRVATAEAIALCFGAIENNVDTKGKLYAISSSVDEYVDIRLLLDLRPGNASWTDYAPWPAVQAEITAVTNNFNFTITMSSASAAPIAGKTIAVWSVPALAFRTAVLQTVASLGDNAYVVTTSAWSGGVVTITTGMQVSPAAGNMSAWGDALLEIFGRQTAGERCLIWQEPWSLRNPIESNDDPTGFGARELGEFNDAFDEINDVEISTINVSEPTRTLPTAGAKILCLRSLSLGVM